MEAISQKPKTSLADLFKPLAPADTAGGGAQGQPAASAPDASLGAQNSGNSAPASSGTISQEALNASLKHTEISSISGPAASGASSQPGAPIGTPGASVSLGGMMQGEWAVNIMDALLPAAMVAGFYAMGLKLRKSELQLTEKEKQTIAPIMQKCLDSVLLNFNNPWNALAITVIAIYGGKLMEKGLVGWLDKKTEKKESEALAEKIAAAEKAANPATHDHANQSMHDLQTGNAVIEGMQPFTESDIKGRMKAAKCNRQKAIEWLKRQTAKQAA